MFGTLQDSKVCLIWATALSVILPLWREGERRKRHEAATGTERLPSEGQPARGSRPIVLQSPAPARRFDPVLSSADLTEN